MSIYESVELQRINLALDVAPKLSVPHLDTLPAPAAGVVATTNVASLNKCQKQVGSQFIAKMPADIDSGSGVMVSAYGYKKKGASTLTDLTGLASYQFTVVAGNGQTTQYSVVQVDA